MYATVTNLLFFLNLSPAGAMLNAAASSAVLHTAAVVAIAHRDILPVEHAKASASERKHSRGTKRGRERKVDIQTLA
jgi:hypothetical protein